MFKIRQPCVPVCGQVTSLHIEALQVDGWVCARVRVYVLVASRCPARGCLEDGDAACAAWAMTKRRPRTRLLVDIAISSRI